MKIYSISIKNKHFAVIGIADLNRKVVHFQALVNGVPCFQDQDYWAVREFVDKAFELNQPEKHEGVN